MGAVPATLDMTAERRRAETLDRGHDASLAKDQNAGVQTGYLVVIIESGAECLRTSPRGSFHLDVVRI